MPEKADISRTLLLPFMSIILLVAVYMTANVLLPLKASGKGSKESEDVQERQHLSDDAGDGEVVEMNINFLKNVSLLIVGMVAQTQVKWGLREQMKKRLILQLQKNYRNGLKMLRLMLL